MSDAISDKQESRLQRAKWRFWYGVERGNSSECWWWRKSASTNGYGKFCHNGKIAGAHRWAWEFTNGPIPDGLFVCHSCDNPACVNPSHLWLGTNAENSADRKAKGPHPRQHVNARTRLDEWDVHAIRFAYKRGVPASALARTFGVSGRAIYSVVYRESWKHLPEHTANYDTVCR